MTLSNENIGKEEEWSELDPEDEAIAELLACRYTHVEGSAKLGISTKTIQRRLANRAFREHMMGRRRQVMAETTAQMVELSTDAMGVMAGLLASDKETIQLQAAQAVLKLGSSFHHADRKDAEFDERLQRIEELLDDEEDQR